MRILHACTSIDPATGGPANVLARLALMQRQRGHEVAVVTADPPDSPDVLAVVENLRAAGVTVFVGGPPRGPFAKGARVKACLAEAIGAGVDLVHVHGLWQHTPHTAMRQAHLARRPFVVRPCGMLDPWSLEQGKWKKRLFLAVRGRGDLNRAAALHYTTIAERDLAAPLQLRPRTFIIPNGIDWSEFETLPAPGRFRAGLGIDASTPLVVFLSRLHYKKGLELLIPAFAESAGPHAHLALVGPGEAPYVESLRRTAASLGIAERVHFSGMLHGPDRITALADADLFCLPSFQENFGVSVVEAAASGTAVLISDQVNIAESVTAADVGRVVPCDQVALAAAIREMLADQTALQEMGARGRAWARDTFDWRAVVSAIDEMYQALTAQSS